MAKPFVVKRRLDELGRIVIPADMRAALKLKMGDMLDMKLEDNKITLTKETVSCNICNVNENLINLDDVVICQSCAGKIQRAISANTKEKE